tara:strand:+ start:609 stop:941 length:333 start_codon:yes stop_codon:yes gene_type:complete
MQLTKLMIEKADRYCEKSLDTKEEFLNPDYRTFVKEFKDETWCEYSVEGDIFWIHTAYSENDTIKRWAEIIQLAKDYGCKSIQFTTQRDPKLWERRFGFKPIAYKMEYKL